MRIVYQARRNLATGHVVDDTYEIVMFAEILDPDYKIERAEQTSLDGTVEHELLYQSEEWLVTTDLIPAGQDEENFREFLSSVAGGVGEPFTFDPESEAAGVDVNPILVYLNTTSLRKSRPAPGYFRYPPLRFKKI